jgi:DNA modification methylase
MKIVTIKGNLIILGTFPQQSIVHYIKKKAGPLNLILADPPYGNIVAKKWDKVIDDDAFAKWTINWVDVCATLQPDSAAFYCWGGIGKPQFRPFFRFLIETEFYTPYRLANLITWKKKRAYGTQSNFLFVREELAWFVNGTAINKPKIFNVPLLDTKRPYPGFNTDYPAKSEYYRRTNVWDDVTELLRGKTHIAEKPVRLSEIVIETHTNPGDWVLDPFCGSGSVGHAAMKLDRRFILIENDPKSFEITVERLKAL